MRISDWSSDVCSSDLTIAGQGQAAFALEAASPVLDVLGNVDDNRSGSAGAGDLERAAHRRFELGGIGDQEYMLGGGAHDRADRCFLERVGADRSEEHTSELQSLMRISYAVFCLHKKTKK